MIIVAVIGSKKSGKTTTVEALVRGLGRRGHSVATAKHISEITFTLDTEGKDTWRHAQAGAQTITVVAPRELAVIKKIETTGLSLQDIVENCLDGTDIAVLEGFRSLVEREPNLPKIVAIRMLDEAVDALRTFESVIAFTGPAASTAKKLGVPVVDVLREPERLVEIVLSRVHLP